MTRVETAIIRSITHDEIVMIDADSEEEFEALNAQLSALSDDGVHTTGAYGSLLHEYWGRDDDGNDWRVHVEVPHPDEYDDA